MSNPFQDQLLKAGIVNKQQVKKANQEKSRKQKQQRHKKQATVDEASIRAQQKQDEKTRRDRELNKKKEEQAKNKALSAEIDQLIENNCLERDESCELIYNFEHRKKINRIYISEDMRQQLVRGKLAIARINGRYELIPVAIAEKIKNRNTKRVIIIENTKPADVKNDEYAGYEVPDDLIW